MALSLGSPKKPSLAKKSKLPDPPCNNAGAAVHQRPATPTLFEPTKKASMLNFNTVTGNANRGGGQYQQQNQVSAPLERIRAIVSKKGIVGVAVPFQTPRANAVRQFIHARLLNRHNQKIFLWRAVMNNMWTNIALNSTPERPELTATPVECCILLMTVLIQCPDVGEVNLYDEEDKILSLDDVKRMEFDDLTMSVSEAANVPLPLLPSPPLETVVEKVNEIARKLDDLSIVTKRDMVQFQTNVDHKLGYIIDKLDGNTRDVYDLGTTRPRRRSRRLASLAPRSHTRPCRSTR